MLMQIKLLAVLMTALMLSSAVPLQAQVRPLDFSELADSLKNDRKPVLLLISTDWCVYCRMQKFQIQRNRQFQKKRTDFYYAELNAETREPLEFNGKTYRYRPGGESSGVHELAVALGRHNGTLAYPTWVVIDRHLRVVYRYSGVLNRKELQQLTAAIEKLEGNFK